MKYLVFTFTFHSKVSQENKSFYLDFFEKFKIASYHFGHHLRKLLHCRIWKLKLSYHTKKDDILYLGYLRRGQPACTNWFLLVISKAILHIHLQFFFVNICCWFLNFNIGIVNYIVTEGVNPAFFKYWKVGETIIWNYSNIQKCNSGWLCDQKLKNLQTWIWFQCAGCSDEIHSASGENRAESQGLKRLVLS